MTRQTVTIDTVLDDLLRPIVSAFYDHIDTAMEDNKQKAHLIQLDKRLSQLGKEVEYLRNKVTNLLWIERLHDDKK